MHLPLENEPNGGFFFHTKVLALVLLCLFTFFLSMKVQKIIFESDDKTFNDAFISTPKVLMLEMTAEIKGLHVYKSHVNFVNTLYIYHFLQIVKKTPSTFWQTSAK